MTYCVGILLDQGIVFASDSRTNAGVDNIAKFCKMTVLERPGERVIVLLSSGNLAGTQAVISLLKQRGEIEGEAPNVWSARTLFDAAGLVADAMRDIDRRYGPYLIESGGFNASFILGGLANRSGRIRSNRSTCHPGRNRSRRSSRRSSRNPSPGRRASLIITWPGGGGRCPWPG